MSEELNTYTCRKCGQYIVTINRCEGVTPMVLGCRATPNCDGVAHSALCRVSGNPEPDYEWRKPSKREYKRMTAAQRDHIDAGGLAIYRVAGKPTAAEQGAADRQPTAPFSSPSHR